jgi:hypothetical protein
MSNWIEKWRGENASLTPERRLMREALVRLEQVEVASPTPAEPAGRLAFVLDLTGSRSASLYHARVATAAMFDTIKAIGSIAVKLLYYRGWRECKASAWEEDPGVVSDLMQRLSCEGGNTQIEKALRRVLDGEDTVSGVVFIGDHCEDSPRALRELAAAFGHRKIPVFVFHEYEDCDSRSLQAKPIFRHLAEASGGVYCEFKSDSAAALRELLTGVAAFSAAGIEGVKSVPVPQTEIGRQLQGRLLLLGPGANGPSDKATAGFLKPLAKDESGR